MPTIPLGLRAGDERDVFSAKWEIENESTFQFKQLYKIMYEWLLEEGWEDQRCPGNKNFEYLYYERTLQHGGQEHHIWWRCAFYLYGNRYFRYVMNVDFQTLDMQKAEVMHKGHKFKTYKGDLILRVESYVQCDYRNEWQKHWLLKHFDKVFRHRIMKEDIELYKKELYNTTYRFEQFVKHFLKLKNPFEMPESYHPQLGI
jgi:hypothetical protein